MVIVPAAFRAMPRWWADAGGRAWLDRLPDLVAEQCRRWELRVDGPPRHGSNALVVPVLQGDERIPQPVPCSSTQSRMRARWPRATRAGRL